MTTSVSMPPDVSSQRAFTGVGFTQLTGLRTGTMEELFDFAVGFSRQPLPKGNRFAIVTNAGGPSITATDATIRRGLELTTLRPETIESLKAKLPPTANFSNPVDVVGDATHAGHKGMLKTVRADFNVDGVVALLAPRSAAVAGGVQPNISTVEDARVGFRKITNGVKQRAPNARLLGVEVVASATQPAG
jgi:acyl-CoA synthetase (NDP forming)